MQTYSLFCLALIMCASTCAVDALLHCIVLALRRRLPAKQLLHSGCPAVLAMVTRVTNCCQAAQTRCLCLLVSMGAVRAYAQQDRRPHAPNIYAHAVCGDASLLRPTVPSFHTDLKQKRKERYPGQMNNDNQKNSEGMFRGADVEHCLEFGGSVWSFIKRHDIR